MGAFDDWWSSNANRWLVILALLSGAGSGAVNFSKDTSDRFKGQDFRREIATRDQEIISLRRRLNTHLEHSARYTQIIIEVQSDMKHTEQRYEDHMDKYH